MNKSVRRLLIGVPLVLTAVLAAPSSAALVSADIDWPAQGRGSTAAASSAAGAAPDAYVLRDIDWPVPTPDAKGARAGSISMHGDVIDWP
ncbi:hypothetical protein ACSNOH_00555 [Streptomyces sp. URMC 127]|uniref:hypothetical protein n=1 Tax=Streptomyces sp. URMC 127 TaxID=3423402 RepID=UPI003F1E2651